MKNLRRRVFPLVPILAMLLSMAISAIKARTAAMLTPCEEQRVAQPVPQKQKAVAARSERTAPRNLAIFIFDGVQTIAAGALRGMNDTRIPLLFAAISYWLVGFPAACGLGFQTGLGAIGVWIGLSCGTAIYAVLLILRFRLLTHRLRLATTVGAH